MITHAQKFRLQQKMILQTVKDLDGNTARERIDAIKFFNDKQVVSRVRVERPDQLRAKALEAARLVGVQKTRAVNDLVEELNEEFSRNIPS